MYSLRSSRTQSPSGLKGTLIQGGTCRRVSELFQQLCPIVFISGSSFSFSASRAPCRDLPRILLASHRRIDAAQFDVMHEAVWIESDGFQEALFRGFVRRHRQVAVKRARQHPLQRVNIGEHPIPAPKDVPGVIVFRVKLEGAVHRLFDLR